LGGSFEAQAELWIKFLFCQVGKMLLGFTRKSYKNALNGEK
jgi:hypothetical protein